MLRNMFVMLHNGVIRGVILPTGRGSAHDACLHTVLPCSLLISWYLLFDGNDKIWKKKKKALFVMNLS